MTYLNLVIKIISRLFFIAVTMAMLLAFLIATNAGSSLLFSTVTLFIPGKIKFESVDGDFHKGLLIHHISYTHNNIRTDIDSISFKINNLHLLQQQIDAESYIKRASLAFISGSSTDSASFALKLNAHISEHPRASFAITHLQGELQHNRLNGSASIIYDNGNIIIPASRFTIANATAEISGIATEQFNIIWRITAPNLAIFYNSAGNIKLNGHITGARLHPTIAANLEGNNIRLPHFRVKKISGNMSANVVNDDEFIAKTTLLTVNAIAESYRLPDLKFDITNLYKNKLLNTDIDVRSQNGSAQIPVLGLHLQQVALNVSTRTNQAIAFHGQFQSGNGKGIITGSYDILKNKPLLNLKLTGKHLQIINTAEYKITASPDITLVTDGEHISISGTTTIPYAKLTSATHQAVAALPDDVVFVHRQMSAPGILDHLSLQLKIGLGEEINFHDDTLEAQLKGGLQLSKLDKGEITAIGDLNILNGKFNAYGQKLMIKVGHLLYTGNLLLNPGLDIVAAKTVGSKTVGAKVRGTLKSPLLTLYSDPAGLSQIDILSYLVFGVPRAQVSAFNAISLLNYLSAGKSKGSQPIKKFTDHLQQTFGLSDIDVTQVDYFDPATNTNGNTTAMSVGKKIGKKLSLHYSVGLLKPVSVFNVRYQLLKKIYVQAESSPIENGADLFYEVEFD